MRHVEKAKVRFLAETNLLKSSFLKIENQEDIKGVAPTVKFTIQSDPIGEVGVNGLQAQDMLHYTKCLFESLNDAFPSVFNEATIQALNIALSFQNARTKDRELRKVEGTNQK